tara:strand:+ start:1209 stop:1685 length:477 start_codon:yes stop_codon:yes gene_type:complete
MALKLTLKPGEKFVINGAVIVNGERRSHLLIQNNVSMLREKDVMQQVEANTPVKHIYFSIQLLYLDETNNELYYEEFAKRMQEFMNVLSDKQALSKCGEILNAVNSKHYYRALMICKKLLPFERSRLDYQAEDNVEKDKMLSVEQGNSERELTKVASI